MIVTKAHVWDVLSDPGSCSEAASAGQKLLDALEDAGETVMRVVSDVAEIVPDVAGDIRRAGADVADASTLIEPTVGRLRELGR